VSEAKTHLDLFSGIGGFALAARWAGFTTVQFVEMDPFCQQKLNKNFPGVPIHPDIKTFGGVPDIYLLTGGFPCQGLSVAGKQKGWEDERTQLWFDMFRIIKQSRPKYIIIENSIRLLYVGYDGIRGQLKSIGYETEAIPVTGFSFGAQHRRKRLYIVAYTGGIRQQGCRVTSVLRERLLSKQALRVFPGWRERSAIPTPRTFRGINGIPNGVDRVKALGNAIVPQIAYQIMKAMGL